jgi:hypothetical protein
MWEESLLHNKQLIPCSFNMKKDKYNNSNYIKIVLPPNTVNKHFTKLLYKIAITKNQMQTRI